MIKAVYDKLRANIIQQWKSERLFFKIRNKTSMPVSLFLFNIVQEAIRQEDEIKGSRIKKEVIKFVSIFRWYDFLSRKS